jgi:outer membrane protein TolC
MVFSNVRIAALVVMATAIALAGAADLAHSQTDTKSGRTQETQAGESKVRTLLKERLAALKQIVDETEKAYRGKGTAQIDDVLQANLAYHRAELDLCESDKDRVAVHEKMVKLAGESERAVSARFDSGSVSHTAVLAARVNRLDAEIALERAKAKAAGQSR